MSERVVSIALGFNFFTITLLSSAPHVCLGMNITTSLLLEFCRNAVTMQGTPFPENNEWGSYGKMLLDQIDRNFVFLYCQSRQVLQRINSECKSRSPTFNEFTPRKVAFQLRNVDRAFRFNEYNENAVESLDETQK